MKKNLTIGFLTNSLHNSVAQQIWQGLCDAARIQHEANVLCFAGEHIATANPANAIYDLASPAVVDGIVMYAGLLGMQLSPEEKRQFWRRYLPLPTVLLEEVEPGFSCVTPDFRGNMRTVVTHLIEFHRYRRIAFIRGPETHSVAELFYQGYQDALAEHEIPFDPMLVAPPLSWYRSDGRRAVQTLFDERCVDVQAIVGANDNLATGAMEALQARGIRVPEDIAVAGHNDEAESSWLVSPLTTIPNPAYEMGRRGVDALFAQIAGESVPEQIVVTARLIVRQSCGCLNSVIEQAGTDPIIIADDLSMTEALTVHRATILRAAVQAIGDSDWASELVEHILDAIEIDLRDPSQQTFLPTLSDSLRRVAREGDDVALWQNVLSQFWRHLRPRMKTTALIVHAEQLWQQARVLIGEIAQQVQGHRAFEVRQQMFQLRELEAELITTFDVQALMNVLAEQLPRLGIPGAYLALYADPANPAAEAYLMLAYNTQGRLALELPGMRFPSSALLPAEIFPHANRVNLIVEPLFFREAQIGFAIFEDERQTAEIAEIYEALRMEISSALQGALLVHRVQEHAGRLEDAHKEIRLLNDQLKDENLSMKAEMELARHIQTSLLPPQIEHLHPDFDMAAVMIPADEVGGDYYDMLIGQDGTLWLAIGDVSGHGVTPGLIMMMAQTIHATLATQEALTPAEVLTRVNRMLYQNVHDRMNADHYMTFTTLKYCGQGRFDHAGSHLDLIVHRQATQTCELIDTEGVFLNFMPEIAYAVTINTFTLDIGDTLVLYTDGLTEAQRPQNGLLDMPRFLEIIRRHAGKAVDEMRNAIMVEILAWCENIRDDDMTLVIVRRIH